MIKERIVNILKRMTFKYFEIVDIDSTNSSFVSIEVRNTITDAIYRVVFPYSMLERWYGYNNLKYDLIKEYILANISEDYHSVKEDIYGG